MTKTMKINGENFKIMKPISSFSLYTGQFKDITECYNRPSQIKQAIFDDWVQWSCEAECEEFGIVGYNGFMFTLGGLIVLSGKMYYIYITKTRQEIYPIVN